MKVQIFHFSNMRKNPKIMHFAANIPNSRGMGHCPNGVKKSPADYVDIEICTPISDTENYTKFVAFT